MNISAHRTNKQAATEGKWFEFDGSRFLIAATGTPAYKAALVKHGQGRDTRKALRKRDLGAIDALMVEVQADVVLLDWEGVTDNDPTTGKPVPVPFSREVAKQLLEQSMEFRQFVESTSTDLENFAEEEAAEDAAALKSGGAVEPGVGAAS